MGEAVMLKKTVEDSSADFILKNATNNINLPFALKGVRSGLPDSLYLDCPRCTNITEILDAYSEMSYNSGLKHVRFNISSSVAQNLNYFCAGHAQLEDIVFDNPVRYTYLTGYTFTYNRALKSIVGGIDGSNSLNTNNIMYAMANLELIEFVQNTLKNSWGFPNSTKLTNECLVNFANGLNESVTGKSITLHATPKAKLSTIIGNVSMDSSETYHVFTEDTSGTTTLEEFIVQTKGWTVA